MGDAKRRKSLDSSCGKNLKVSNSKTYLIGVPDELLTGKYIRIKKLLADTVFTYMKPDVVRGIIEEAKRRKLSNGYVVFNPETDEISYPVPIDKAVEIVKGFVDEAYLHPCAIQEFADILTKFNSPDNIKYLAVVYQRQTGNPWLYSDFMKSSGVGMFLFLTIHSFSTT